MQSGLTWCFNLPAGSSYGGVWERLICIVKKVLSSTLSMEALIIQSLEYIIVILNPS